MQPRDLPISEKKALALTMAGRSDISVSEIARALGVPHKRAWIWAKSVRGVITRPLWGLSRAEVKQNGKWRRAGLSVQDRARMIEEMRRAS